MLISILNPWIKLNSLTFLLYFKHNVLTHKAKDKTYCTWRQWWCRFPVITWPAGWGRGWGQNKIHTTECSRTAEHPTGEQTAAQDHELNTVHLQTQHQSLYKALTAWTLLDGDMEVNWLFGELCNLLPFNVGWFGTGASIWVFSHLLDVHDRRQEGGSVQFCDEGARRRVLVFVWMPGFPLAVLLLFLSHQVSLEEAVWSTEVPDEGLFNGTMQADNYF